MAGAVVAARTAKKDNVCDQNTLTRHIFSCLHACLTVSHVTLAQGVVRVIPSMFHALVCLTSLRLCHFALFTVSLIFYFILLIFIFTFYVGSVRREFPLCASAYEESDSLVNNAPLTMWSGSFGTLWSATLNDTNGVTSVGDPTSPRISSCTENIGFDISFTTEPSKRRRRRSSCYENGSDLNLSSHDLHFVANS